MILNKRFRLCKKYVFYKILSLHAKLKRKSYLRILQRYIIIDNVIYSLKLTIISMKTQYN